MPKKRGPMPLLFRHADRRFAFLWESNAQPPGRWHAEGDGPVHYLADTPEGAWAEFLRHEEITDPADLEGVRRALWAVELPRLPAARPRLLARTLRGGLPTYPACQGEAQRLRRRGARGLVAPSAALQPGAAGGWRTDGGLQPGPPRDGTVVALFGPRPDLIGWRVADARPSAELLPAVRPLRDPTTRLRPQQR